MKKYLINNNSDTLLLVFAGWGADEYAFEHLKSDFDVLILYDYSDLNLDFDFSKYKNFNLVGYSAGVFAASVLNFDLEFDKKIAFSGNPYLFDEYLGLSKQVQEVLYNVTEENADDFVRNYLVKTDEEYKNFHPSKRSVESCRTEFDKLREIYKTNKHKIKDIYDVAYIGEYDPVFSVSAQKEFYKNKLNIVKNARHNMFYRIKNFSQMLKYQEFKILT